MKKYMLTVVALFGLFLSLSSHGQAQIPTDGLILWLDSSYPASVQTNADGSINNWLNLAPGATGGVSYTGANDNDTATAYNSSAPVYGVSASSHGRAVVNFNGNGYLDALNFSSETPLDLTIFIVAAATTNRGDYSAFMAFDEGEAANDYQTGLNFDQGQNPSATFNRLNLEGAKGGGYGGFQLLDTASLQFGTFYLFELDYGGGSASNDDVFSILVNGVLAGSETGSANVVDLNNLYIGARCFAQGYTTGANNDMIGQIAAVLVYDHQLAGTELTQTREYLATMLNPQLSLTSTTAGNATLSWSCVAGLGYELQTTTNLLSAWQTISGTVSSTSSTIQVPVSIGAEAERFFRLQLGQQ